MSAGYSGTPLVKKLGIKPGHRVRFVQAPKDYAKALGPLPPDTTLLTRKSKDLDVVHLFSTDSGDLARRLPAARDEISKTGMVWVSWPKKASGIKTDLSGDVVRGIGLDAGLVDVKVCAVDEVWSGLKFVWRVRDR